ncbi:MAG: MmcQ/YjbR family DNA-binding protein [Desulfuromonadales bacterium]|nr:MmcQ/YjbR family DNA-binding protein [Desulfuromonadales bacterium]
MFALTNFSGVPLRINLKCDLVKAEFLRAHYSSVTPDYHMIKKLWNNSFQFPKVKFVR